MQVILIIKIKKSPVLQSGKKVVEKGGKTEKILLVAYEC